MSINNKLDRPNGHIYFLIGARLKVHYAINCLIYV